MPAARLYYDDPFLTEFTATITDIREHSRGVWQLALDRSAFYPTSGGQPFDTGTLFAAAPSGARLTAQITNVTEDDTGDIWHTTGKPLAAGTAISAQIDWGRRLDHMQQHTGQHLLSAAFYRELNAATVSFHLGETTSTIDLATANLTAENIVRIQRLTNEIIAEDRPVTVETVARTVADTMLTAGALRKLPDRHGPIRLIRIANFDLNACGGTHVRTTGQIGGLHIRTLERVRQGIRVEFVCGLRAATAAHTDFDRLTTSANTLFIPAAELPSAIQRLLADNKAAAKLLQVKLEEIAIYEASTLIAGTPIQDNLRLIERAFPSRDLSSLKMLASKIVAGAPATIALLTNDSDPANVVFARSVDLTLDCGTLLKEALATHGRKGGGSKEMAQGSLPRASLNGCLTDLRTRFG